MFSKSAELYDQIYFEFKDYKAEAQRISELLAGEHSSARTLLDVACGTGEHARILRDQYGFEVDGIDHHHEFHGGHEILPNFRSDFDFRGTRIIITGSLLGRYEKDSNLPLVQEAYKLFKDSVADTVTKKLDSL